MLINIGPFAVNVTKRARTRKGEFVHADELKVGDRVIVECEVTHYRVFNDPKFRHVHARPLRGWNAGDQYLWTYGWRQDGDTEPSMQVLR